jgi:hypothetical protein
LVDLDAHDRGDAHADSNEIALAILDEYANADEHPDALLDKFAHGD